MPAKKRSLQEAIKLIGIPDFDAVVETQFERLVPVCRSIVRHEATAEDVAQETLIKLVNELQETSASKLKQFKKKNWLTNWLRKVARNASIDWKRQAERRDQKDETGAAAENADGSERDKFESVMDKQAMSQAGDIGSHWLFSECSAEDIRSLTEDEQKVFILRHTSLEFTSYDLEWLLGRKLADRLIAAKEEWRQLQNQSLKKPDDKPKNMPEKLIAQILGMRRGTVSSHSKHAREKLAQKLAPYAQVKLRRMLKPPPKRKLGKLVPEKPIPSPVRDIPVSQSRRIALIAPEDPKTNSPGPKRDQLRALRKQGYPSGNVCRKCKRRDVWRSFEPERAGWTFKCYPCGARDEDCVENSGEIGKRPRMLPKSEKKKATRKRS